MKFEYDGMLFTGTKNQIKDALRGYLNRIPIYVELDKIFLGEENMYIGFGKYTIEYFRNKLKEKALAKLSKINFNFNGKHFESLSALDKYLDSLPLIYINCGAFFSWRI